MADRANRFVWYELLTTDTAAAQAFYAKVVGWEVVNASTPGLSYAFFSAAGLAVGGLASLSPRERGFGAKARWFGYVGVDDVDATAARVPALGGKVQVPPTDVPGVSRFAAVTDPQEAALVLVKGLRPREQPPAGLRTPGHVGWHELHAADYEQAFAFYGELFGWQKGVAGIGGGGPYQLFAAGGDTIGGMLNKPATAPLPFWLYYFNVGDIDAAAERVVAAGGEVLNSPDEAPDGSWTVQCIDPQDAMFALVGKRRYGAVGFLDRVMPRPSTN